jgi:hypothetical protein
VSAGINVCQAFRESGFPNVPKLVANSSDIAGQSLSVTFRSFKDDVRDDVVPGAITELDVATPRCPAAPEFQVGDVSAAATR